MSIEFVDLKRQYLSIKDEIDEAIAGVIDESAYILGDRVAAFEEAFAAYCGAKHVIGVANGTDGLRLALIACGVAPGDEVITVPNSFIATAEPIAELGAIIRFIDVRPDTMLMDVDQLAGAITEKTKAIVPVHLYGQMCEMDRIMELAEAHDLVVIEDACQAHGARLGDRRAGAIGDAAAFSFYPGKNLGAYGDGGCVTTNSDAVAAIVRLMRDHGRKGKYEHEVLAFNSRLDGLQAAILSVKLKHLDDWNVGRRANAARYAEALADVAAAGDIVLPVVRDDAEPVWHLYVAQVTKDVPAVAGRRARNMRDELRNALATEDIATGIHYPVPLHVQPAVTALDLGYGAGDFPVTEAAAERIVSLPHYAELTEDDISQVADAVREFLARPEEV